jgi:hypothetical protein
VVPFWHGTVPLSGPIGALRLGTSGQWRPDSSAKRNKWVVRYGAYAVGNAGKVNQILLPEAYLQAGLGKFYISAGRKREIIGLGDSTLSSGFYSWSQNAQPITKVQIGTNGFVPVGFTKGLLSFNFLFAHGWFPNTDSVQNMYLHQKALYGRIGKPNWKVKLYAGVIHNAQWGGRSPYAPKSVTRDGGYLPASFRDYLYVITLHQPANSFSESYTNHELLNQVGNHLGSIDIGTEIRLRKSTLLLYYQHAYDDKSGVALYNMPDGLYGFSLSMNQQSNQKIKITKFLVEYLNTMNQSGPYVVIADGRYSGNDDYFNHDQYLDGWANNKKTIGTPFITPHDEAVAKLSDLDTKRPRIMLNNQVKLIHVGLEGRIGQTVRFQSKLSLSRNFGRTRMPFPAAVNQFSGFMGFNWQLKWLGGSELQTALALDQGNLLNNSVGGWLKIRKTW